MKKCIIYFNQGWTDIILCIGFVFYFFPFYNEINVLIRQDSQPMIDFIFKKYKKINILYAHKSTLDNKQWVDLFSNKYKNNYDLLFTGSHAKYGKFKNIKKSSCGTSNGFYQIYGIDPENSWKLFNIERNYELENIQYNNLINKIGTDYICIFHDIERNLAINEKYIVNKNLPRFNLSNCSKICFDMLAILENATEIHILSTFWSLIIYQLQKKDNLFSNIPIYFHNTVRNGYFYDLYKNNKWIIV